MMKLDLLNILKCPYCGANFKVYKIISEENGDILNGFINCRCSKFMILEGILNLKQSPLNSYLKKLLANKKQKTAIAMSLLEKNESIFYIVKFLGVQKKPIKFLKDILLFLLKFRLKSIYRKYFDESISFFNSLGSESYDIYLKHRYSMETFWSIYPFISLLKPNKGIFLDLCCGTGHSSFIISNYINPSKHICIDSNFKNLYLAKKYFVKDASYICFDINYPLPFKTNIFSAILIQDAFYLILNRTLLIKEIERTLRSEGLFLLLSLPNSLRYYLGTGGPLSPEGWKNLFNQFPVKLIPEIDLIKNFVLMNKLDLKKEYSNSELKSSNNIAIIGSKCESFFKIYMNVDKAFFEKKDKLLLNPLYGITYDKDKLKLKRLFPNERFKEQYPLSVKYLPENFIIDKELSKFIEERYLNLKSSEISSDYLLKIEYLMKKFILINVPKNFY